MLTAYVRTLMVEYILMVEGCELRLDRPIIPTAYVSRATAVLLVNRGTNPALASGKAVQAAMWQSRQ